MAVVMNDLSCESLLGSVVRNLLAHGGQSCFNILDAAMLKETNRKGIHP